MPTLTLVDGDRAVDVDATVRGATVLIGAGDLERTIGWDLRSEGLCRGDVCVPVHDMDAVVSDGLVDIAGVAAALQRPLAVEPEVRIAVLGEAADDLAAALAGLRAPAFTLPDVDGGEVSLGDFADRKRLVLAWASWCGCRWDLPVWQQLHEELEPDGLQIIAIALDEDVELARACARDESPVLLTYPVLVDRDHRFAELYGARNVPTTVWIDEDDRIVRPPAIAPGDDTFKDFTKIESGLHHDALRRWVREDVAPMTDDEVRERQHAPTPEEQQARAERRLAAYLLRADRADLAGRHFARAMELAPDDWTIHRGSMPLRGEDPFGEAFFEFMTAWEDRGRPGYES
jgi:peroxiredoxin